MIGRSYCLVGERHELLDQPLLDTLMALGADHVPTGLVECMYLLRGEVVGNLPHSADDLIDEGLVFTRLQCYEMPPALVRNLDECVTSHVLDAWTDVSIVYP